MKKKGWYLFATCILASLLLFATACSTSKKPSDSTSEETLKLSETTLSMEIYSTYVLNVETQEDGTITWTSSAPSIVSVKDGELTALAIGEATITAKQGNAVGTCVVTVTGLSSYPVLETNVSTLELLINGEPVSVTASVRYKTQTVDCVFGWASDNEAVATVKDGLVTPVGIGSAIITVSTECYGESLSKKIPIEVKPDMEIRVSKTSMQLNVWKINDEDVTEGTFTAEAYKEGEKADGIVISYRSDNEDVATVVASDGSAVVTAVGAGTCNIFAYSDVDGYELKTAVKVTVVRSQLSIYDEIVLEIADNSATIDIESLSLLGIFEGVYEYGELVSDGATGSLSESFINAHNDNVAAAIELRTSVASYSAQIRLIFPYVLDPVIRQGDAGTVLPEYNGDVTELGFEAGSYVQEFVIGGTQDIWGARTIIDMDSTKDFVGFEFVLAQEFKEHHALTIWTVKGGAVDVRSRIIGDGSYGYDRVDSSVTVVITDKEGNDVTNSKLSANALYTMKIYAKGSTQLQVGTSEVNFTMYMSNVFVGNDEALAALPEHYFTYAEGGKILDKYEGSETDLGFKAGSYVQQLVTDGGSDLHWNLRMLLNTTKSYTRFQFVLPKAFPERSDALLIWVEKSSLTQIATIPGNSAYTGSISTVLIVDEDGYNVTSVLSAHKVYTMQIFTEGASNIQIGTPVQNFTMYLSNIVMSDTSIEVTAPENPGTTLPDNHFLQGDSRSVLAKYDGDETELGFEAGSYVQQLVMGDPADTWGLRMVVNTNKPYTSFQFRLSKAFTAGNGSAFMIWVEGTGLSQAGFISAAGGFSPPSDAQSVRILIVDEDGYNVMGSPLSAGKVYTMQIFAEGIQNIQIGTGETNITIYVSNIVLSDTSIEVTEPENPGTTLPDNHFLQGDDRNVLAKYDGDETELGFTKGSYVQQLVMGDSADTWGLRMVINTNKPYTSFQFVLSKEFTAGNGSAFMIWVQGSALSGAGFLSASGSFTPPSDASVIILIVDENGYNVTGSKLSANKVNTMQIFAEDIQNIQIGTSETNITIYVSNIVLSDTSIQTKSIVKQGDDQNVLATYDGDETELGFEEGTFVQQYEVGDSIDFWGTRATIDTDGTKDYTSVQISLSQAFGGSEALIVWAMKDGSPVLVGRIGNEGYSVAAEGFKVVIEDADGNDVTNSTLSANTVYTLKIYYAGATRIDIGLNQANTTIYFANATSGNDAA